MGNDLFGSIGGLVKGFVDYLPQDDPDVMLMKVRSEIDDMKKQETEIYAEIGRQAVSKHEEQYPEAEQLRLIQANLTQAQVRLEKAENEKAARDKEKQSEEAECTCYSCGCVNSPGVKFCRECGARLGPVKCRRCGAELAPGTRFCGECGANQEETEG